MKQYLCEKNGWEEETFLNFDWDAIELALNTYKPYKQTKIAQLMHRWQYVGERKVMMNDGSNLCPAGCGEVEEGMHYLYCTSREMVKRRQKHYTLLVKQLTALNTYPGIIAALTKILQQGWDETWMTGMPMKTLMDIYLVEAVTAQASDHCTYLARGYIVKQWKKAQSE